MIIEVDEERLADAARIHSLSWQASHRSFCTEQFVALHSPEHQAAYLREELAAGKRLYMLVEERPVGIVTVHQNLIENLYILPDEQRKGYGTQLLRYAMELCPGVPTLWILENNDGARRLYHREGFAETGAVNAITGVLNEIELAYRDSAENKER